MEYIIRPDQHICRAGLQADKQQGLRGVIAYTSVRIRTSRRLCFDKSL